MNKKYHHVDTEQAIVLPPYPQKGKNGESRFSSVFESFQYHVKRQRKVLKISQEYAASRCGVAKPTYVGYELGRSQPNLEQFIKVCNAMYLPYSTVIDDAEDEL